MQNVDIKGTCLTLVHITLLDCATVTDAQRNKLCSDFAEGLHQSLFNNANVIRAKNAYDEAIAAGNYHSAEVRVWETAETFAHRYAFRDWPQGAPDSAYFQIEW